MASDSISLGRIQYLEGRGFSEVVAEEWVRLLCEALDLKRSLSDDLMELAAQEIVNDYYYFKLADLALLRKRILTGAYGELYESINIPKLLGFFKKYSDERFELAEYRSQMDHGSQKSADQRKRIE